MELLKRKIDNYLIEWKNSSEKLPLVVKGARQIGKTKSIEKFAFENYKNVIEINFVLDEKFKSIFDGGYSVDSIISAITFIDPSITVAPGETLIFFDEIQDCIKVATSLKAFALDGRYDVICSGSMMGIKYNEIESVSVGYKEDYEMYSMDFEEFLWAKGYNEEQLEIIYAHMKELKPFSELEMKIFTDLFHEYMVIGGMPHVVKTFVENKNYSGTLKIQRQILSDYEEDIVKYAHGLDHGKILNVYKKIPMFLGQENKKFQISKIEKGARNREYIGVVDWLDRSAIINICYCMQRPLLPIKGNFNPDCYKIYFADTGLLVASLDDEAQEDLRVRRNYGTYKGAIYENIIGDMLKKAGYNLCFYRNEKGTLEMDFFVRSRDSLIPVEVKAKDGETPSLNKLIEKKEYADIKFGIKLAEKNIGFNGRFYIFPYFTTFLLKRFIAENF